MISLHTHSTFYRRTTANPDLTLERHHCLATPSFIPIYTHCSLGTFKRTTTNTIKLATQILSRTPSSLHLDRPYSPPNAAHQTPNVDISLLLKPKDARPGDVEDDRARSSSASPTAGSSVSGPSVCTTTNSAVNHQIIHAAPGNTSPSPSNLRPQPQSLKRAASTAELPTTSPAKKQSKWSPDEDAKIIQLRGDGMKWEDISKHLPGRSAISCRLHYQNYLERRSEWDEDRKNKLARLYER